MLSFVLIVPFCSFSSMQFPIRESSTKALGRYLLYKIQSDPSNNALHAQIVSSIVSALRDDSSEVRRRALSALKAAAKVRSFSLSNVEFSL